MFAVIAAAGIRVGTSLSLYPQEPERTSRSGFV